ncbi:MAG: hypothetical protein A2Z14_10450 [Chloroflexi bacterium RBG_16_48_8]|nr:MAG: hypothetical protein A2Z14_10450 [Chloroflexi bacterium RBG_16_48_8]
MNLSIIIPLYNEVENIPRLKRELSPILTELAQSHIIEVVFVDDGSTDSTYKTLLDAFTDVISPHLSFCIQNHPHNHGLGAALRTGFSSAKGDIIVTTDSDGSYRFNEIPDLLSCLRQQVDIVTASPYHPDGKVLGVKGYRVLLSRCSSMIYRLLVDWRIHTYTSLFRAYRREVIEKVDFQCDGYLAVAEILINSILMDYRVVEYPTNLYKRTLGFSKVKLARTIMDHLGYQTRVLFHRLGLKSVIKHDYKRRIEKHPSTREIPQ